MTHVTREPYGSLSDGRDVMGYVLANDYLSVSLIEWGVRATAITAGATSHNLLLSHPDLASYEADKAYLGAVVGRYANRVRDARFSLDGREVPLSVNRNNYHLHGGVSGFAHRLWCGEPIEQGVRFSLHSPDGEEGYPGNLDVNVEVQLVNNVLEYRYLAATDRDTVINLTNHSYFNLDGGGDILHHGLQLEADEFLAIDDEILPTGAMLPVEGTAFDFTRMKRVGLDIDDPDPQLILGGGYDHCFVLREAEVKNTPRLAATLEGSLARMKVYTTEPGIQFYSGNQLTNPRQGLCLETQHFPDSPNHPEFPSTLLRAGQNYASITRFEFEVVSRL